MNYNDDGDLVTIVEKQSKLGFTTNKRLLVLRDGCLYYYSKVPKELNKFQSPNIKTLKMKDYPKSAIDSSYIHQVRADQRQPKTFEIQFEAKHLMETEDIRNSVMVEEYNFQPRNSTQIIKWRFTCETNEVRNLWVKHLNKSIKQNLDIQKFVKEYSGEKVSPHKSMRKSVTPWKVNEQQEKMKEEEKKETTKFQQLLREEQRLRTERINREQTERRMEEKQVEDKQVKAKQENQPRQQIVHQSHFDENPAESQQNTYNQHQSQPSSQLPDSLHNLLKDTDSETGLDTQHLVVETHDHTKEDQMKDDHTNGDQKDDQKDETKHEQRGFLTQRLEIPEQPEIPIDLDEYYSLTDSLFEGTFRQKLDKQLSYRQYQLKFEQQASSILEQMVNEMTENNQNKTYSLTSDTKQLTVGRILFKFAFVRSKNIKSQHYFDCSQVRQLRSQFNAYCHIDSAIMKMLKKGKSIRLRVPLVCLLQYRGIIALASRINEDQLDVTSYIQLIHQFASEYRLQQLNGRWLIVYVHKSKIMQKDKMYKNITIQTLRHMRNINKSISLGQLKMEREHRLSEPLTQVNREQVEFLDECIVSKHLRTIYRSGQGQLDDLDFWSLVFNNDESIVQMLKSLGCEYIPELRCSILSIFRHYFGCTFQFQDINDLKTLKKVRYRPFSKMLSIQSLQLEEISLNFQKFIKQNKIQLAKQSLKIRQQLGQDQQGYLYDSARLHYAQYDNIESIKISNQLLNLMPPYELKRFDVLSLLMRNYLYAAPNQINKIFKDVVDLTILLYNDQHSLLVPTYCLMAHSLSNIKQYQMAVTILKEAMKLATKAHGRDSKECKQIMLDMINNMLLLGDAASAQQLLKSIVPSDTLDGYKFHIYQLKLLMMKKQLKQSKEYLLNIVECLKYSKISIDNKIIVFRNLIQIFQVLQLKKQKMEFLDEIFKNGSKSSIKLMRYAISCSFKDFIKKTSRTIIESIRQHENSEIVEICAEEISEYYKGFNNITEMVEHVLSNVMRHRSKEYGYLRSLVLAEELDGLLESYQF